MPEITTLSAERRARAGKGAARATRRMGRVPGIIYGGNQDPMLISLEPRELSRALAKRGFLATLVEVRVDGGVHRTLPRDVQYHPATDEPLHVDFMRVGADTRVTVTVPVVFINPEMSIGLRRGGILNIVRHGDRADLPGGQHPRAAGRGPQRARHRRQRPHQRGELRRRARGRRSPTAILRSPASPRPRRCARRLPPLRRHLPRPSSPRQAEFFEPGFAASAIGWRCVSSSASAIRALATPGTVTMSASWRSTRSPGGTVSRAFATGSRASLRRASIGGERRLLLKPQTFMNDSGEAVAETARFFKIFAVGDRRHP